MKSLSEKFAEIISAPRFWQLFLVGAAGGLIVAFPESRVVLAFSVATGIWFGGSVGVGTADRMADKKVEAAKIEKKTEEIKATAVVEAAQITAAAQVEVANKPQ